ncbi:glycosyltransferase family 39 protein [Streptomyces actuosus]|uniref:Glycosyltransferase family 39 protein n=1 Tax=Streptomyces actuosus TaxID=1885 RepID=A0ABS2W0K3_STRAS|nr:glycosyltransferase family 39 protein [Streptomyces actuosus]MBN0048931.1 glycosyltransferase family 39 protein [Streptomyces actuosus]
MPPTARDRAVPHDGGPGRPGTAARLPAPHVPPPPALLPVTVVACATGVLLLLTAGRFGYFSDELYFLAAGRHPAWGYADQPPLLPLLAHALDTVAPGSLVGLRAPAAAVTALGVLITALITRELGGRRAAQTAAAGAYAVSPVMLQMGHLLITATLDIFLTAVTTWLLVRWVRTRSDRLLPLLGLTAALSLQVKYLSPGFWAVLLVAVLLVGPRALLRRPLLWVSAAGVLLTALPGLLWQARHGWPQLAMASVISREVAADEGGRSLFLPTVLAAAGLAGAVLLCAGLLWLLFARRARPHRFLGLTFAGLCACYLLVNGRPYYVAGLFPALWAAGATALQSLRLTRPRLWAVGLAYLLSAALAVQVLPVYPVHRLTARGADRLAMESVGWPDLASSVARVYRGLPPGRRRRALIVTDRYDQAGALDRYGPALGLPRPYSGHRGYWYLRRPADDFAPVVFVGADARYLRRFFTSVHRRGTVTNAEGVPNLNRGAPIWVCEGEREPWGTLWPRLSHLNADSAG